MNTQMILTLGILAVSNILRENGLAPFQFFDYTPIGIILLAAKPHAFLMAVAIAASVAFASPVASPTNTLVMGAGNYSFSNYIKVGLPLILLAMLISVLVLPILWPLG